MTRVDVPTLRAAWWTLRAERRARRELAREPLAAPALPAAPASPRGSYRGVGAVLRRTRPTCLVGAAVRQAWYAANGDPRDVVLGVTAPSSGFRGHAWLDGDPPEASRGYHEFRRLPARAVEAAGAAEYALSKGVGGRAR